MTTRVFLVGQGLFCDGLARLLSEQPALKILGSAATMTAAQAAIAAEQADIILIDRTETDIDPVALIPAAATAPKVISLSLDGNDMVVYSRRRIGDVDLPGLLAAMSETRVAP